MLQLKDVVKDYPTATTTVHALRKVSLNFRESEFVAILGPSGCGKTTMLNIIGGLDRYTSGDLVIGGVSTAEFDDEHWDAYRNATIGFVFQSYNLIPHLTVSAYMHWFSSNEGSTSDLGRTKYIVAFAAAGMTECFKIWFNHKSSLSLEELCKNISDAMSKGISLMMDQDTL